MHGNPDDEMVVWFELRREDSERHYQELAEACLLAMPGPIRDVVDHDPERQLKLFSTGTQAGHRYLLFNAERGWVSDWADRMLLAGESWIDGWIELEIAVRVGMHSGRECPTGGERPCPGCMAFVKEIAAADWDDIYTITQMETMLHSAGD